jgi:hypothetical protein
MAVQIKVRNGTKSQWASANPVLAEGEMGLETDTRLFKIGNGSSTWNQLNYWSPPHILSPFLFMGAK